MAVFKKIPLSSIFVGDRARPVDEDYAQAIAANMQERGLIAPITVRSTPAKKKFPYTLVAGGHRYRGAAINGWGEIDALVVEADAAEAQLIEISENLFRNELSALDRALFVMKFREAWEDKNGKIDRTANLKQSKGNDYPSVFGNGRALSSQVCERLGFGPETYKKVNQIGQNLHPSLRSAIRGTAAERDQSKLLRLCRLPADDQVKIAAALKQHPDLDAAMGFLKPGKTEVDPQAQLLERLMSTWEKASEATREEFLQHIGLSDAPDQVMNFIREAAE